MLRRRHSRPGVSTADSRAALKEAMERLAKSRGEAVGEYPHCVRLLRDLRDEADGWLVLFVREAIERGHRWADVGEMLGVSRQAAHEKYAPLILAIARQTVEQET